MNYVLDSRGNPVPEPNLLKWAKWFDTAERVVAKEKIGESVVSTVFLGTEHNYTGHGPPVLWETMVFGGALDHEQDRCAG